MKNPTKIFLSLVLVVTANQVLAQDTESPNKLAEVMDKQSAEDPRYGYAAPNEVPGNTASGCWSDYLRQIYLEDSAAYGADLLATSKPE